MSRIAGLYRLSSHAPAPAPETSSAGATFGPWADHDPFRCKCSACR
jgi:hypothetical protein